VPVQTCLELIDVLRVLKNWVDLGRVTVYATMSQSSPMPSPRPTKGLKAPIGANAKNGQIWMAGGEPGGTLGRWCG
jgi:hypothetical protein